MKSKIIIGSTLLLLTSLLVGCNGSLPTYYYEEIEMDGKLEYALCIDNMDFIASDWSFIIVDEQIGLAEYEKDRKYIYRVKDDNDFNFVVVEGTISRPPSLRVRTDATLPEIGRERPNKIMYKDDLTSENVELSINQLEEIYEAASSAEPFNITVYNYRPLYIDLYFDDLPGVYYSMQIMLQHPRIVQNERLNGRIYYELTIDKNTAGDILKAIGIEIQPKNMVIENVSYMIQLS